MFTEHLIHASDQVLCLRDLVVSKTACLVFMAHRVTYKEVNRGVPGPSPRLSPSFSLSIPLEFPGFKESPLCHQSTHSGLCTGKLEPYSRHLFLRQVPSQLALRASAK